MKIKIDSKKKLAALITLFVMVVIVLLFFGVYACARTHTLILGNVEMHGSVDYDEFKASDKFNVAEYPQVTVDGEAKVLYLTDTHFVNFGWHADLVWSMEAFNRSVMKDIRSLVAQTNPDLIVLTGDAVADTLNDIVFGYVVRFMESLQIPWTFVFGNLDAEHRADKPKISNILANPQLKYCQYEQGAINLQGLGNNMVVIRDKSGKLMHAIILLDTGDWKRAEKPGKPFSTYTVGISDSQVKWYNWLIDGLTVANGGVVVPTTVACHIPNDGYNFALKIGVSQYGGTPYSVNNFSAPDEKFDYTAEGYDLYIKTNKFMNSVTNKVSTTHIVSGHSHSAGYATSYRGITYTSVAKTGDIYVDHKWDGGERGGTIMSINIDGTVVNNKAIHIVK